MYSLFAKGASHKASLILIDRSLDLAGPASHTTDCLADQIVGLLPPLQTGSSDVYVDMSETFSQPMYGILSRIVVLRAC